MTNPLLQKYDEIYGKKEEHPPKNTKVGYELDPDFVEKLKDVETLSSVSGNLGYGITASNFDSTTNSSVLYKPWIKPVKTYDTDSTLDAFMQVADKVKNGTAKVESVTMEMDMVGSFAAGKKITFEVYVYN